MVWSLSALIVVVAMVLAGEGEWVIRAGHFAERHGLIVIIALGEVIVAIGLPVFAALEAEEGIPGRTIIALVAAGAFAALIWWGYFDRPGPALEHRAESVAEHERGRYARDVYTWAHAPIVVGIILSAAALEEITLHPTHALALPFRAMLIGGLGLLACGVVLAIRRAVRRDRERATCVRRRGRRPAPARVELGRDRAPGARRSRLARHVGDRTPSRRRGLGRLRVFPEATKGERRVIPDRPVRARCPYAASHGDDIADGRGAHGGRSKGLRIGRDRGDGVARRRRHLRPSGVHRDHGAVRVGQVDADALPRRA